MRFGAQLRDGVVNPVGQLIAKVTKDQVPKEKSLRVTGNATSRNGIRSQGNNPSEDEGYNNNIQPSHDHVNLTDTSANTEQTEWDRAACQLLQGLTEKK